MMIDSKLDTKPAHAVRPGNLLRGNPGFVRVDIVRHRDGMVFVEATNDRGPWSRAFRSDEIVTFLPRFREEEIRREFALLPAAL